MTHQDCKYIKMRVLNDPDPGLLITIAMAVTAPPLYFYTSPHFPSLCFALSMTGEYLHVVLLQ